MVFLSHVQFRYSQQGRPRVTPCSQRTWKISLDVARDQRPRVVRVAAADGTVESFRWQTRRYRLPCGLFVELRGPGRHWFRAARLDSDGNRSLLAAAERLAAQPVDDRRDSVVVHRGKQQPAG